MPLRFPTFDPTGSSYKGPKLLRGWRGGGSEWRLCMTAIWGPKGDRFAFMTRKKALAIVGKMTEAEREVLASERGTDLICAAALQEAAKGRGEGLSHSDAMALAKTKTEAERKQLASERGRDMGKQNKTLFVSESNR